MVTTWAGIIVQIDAASSTSWAWSNILRSFVPAWIWSAGSVVIVAASVAVLMDPMVGHPDNPVKGTRQSCLRG